MRFSMLVKTPKGELEQVCKKSTIVIGQAGECDLVIDDPSVSRRHSLLEFESPNFFITDLNSLNGTWINGQQISSRIRISMTDKIQIGAAILKFKDVEENCGQTVKMPIKNLLATGSPLDQATVAGPLSIESKSLTPKPPPIPPVPPTPPTPSPNPVLSQGDENTVSTPGQVGLTGQFLNSGKDRFYLSRGNQTYGPYNWAEICNLGQKGNLYRNDLLRTVQSNADKSWIPVSDFEALRGFLVKQGEKKESSKKALILVICGALFIGVILVGSLFFFRKTPGQKSEEPNSVDTMQTTTVPPIEDIRTLEPVKRGSKLEVFSSVPGQLEILTDSDETMGKSTGDNPWIKCTIPIDQPSFKIRFSPSNGTLGTQRTFLNDSSKKTTHIQLSPDGGSPNSFLFMRTFVSANQMQHAPAPKTKDLDTTIAELEAELGLSEKTKKQKPKTPLVESKRNKKKQVAVKPSTEAKVSGDQVVWSPFVIPTFHRWSMNREKSDEKTLTLQADMTQNKERVVLEKEVFDIPEGSKKDFLKQMVKRFKNDPTFSKVSLDKRSRYTVLGDKKCPLITAITKDAVKMFILLPYCNGKFYMVIARTSEINRRRLSPDSKDLVEHIHFLSGQN